MQTTMENQKKSLKKKSFSAKITYLLLLPHVPVLFWKLNCDLQFLLRPNDDQAQHSTCGEALLQISFTVNQGGAVRFYQNGGRI